MSKFLRCFALLCVFAFPVVLFGQQSTTGPQAANLPALKSEAVAEVDKMQTLTQQMVDQIFSFSELGFQEIETSRYVTGLLEKHGFQVERGVAGIPTAWVATYGSGKPVIAFITDIDCIPRASQKPGVAYHDPIVESAPGHGEGHNSGMAVNVVASLVLKKMMAEHDIAGTIKIFPGVAEELVATKAFYIRAGLFKDVDIVLGSHVWDKFATSYAMGNGEWSGLVSIQYFFHGKAAHAAVRPWEGRSALDAVELMDTGWDYRREHLRPAQRSHRVILNGGDQPNVVPSEAAVWYYFRELDFSHIKDLYEIGNTMADAAAKMTGTSVDHRLVGSAWPPYFNKTIAEDQQKNIEAVGMPQWSDDDQKLAKALQKDIGAKEEGLKTKVDPLEEPAKNPTGGGSDDVGDISWNVPMVYLMFPANIPNLPGHSWPNAVAMATPIAHKGSTAGAKVQAMTALDFMLQPELVTQAWDYFHNVQTKEIHYESFLAPDDRPMIEMNKSKMDAFRTELKKYYYDPAKYKTYLDQLGIKYPTLKTAQ
ncbi:MAG: amidohydrolase [Acidobacteria bacterium]|nr:amidohydrolase [Acidobacteriota bacterium]